jgi:hypothetical protein
LTRALLTLELLLDLYCGSSFAQETILLAELIGRKMIRVAIDERDWGRRTLDDAFNFEVSCVIVSG